jgi:beta-lactamase class C
MTNPLSATRLDDILPRFEDIIKQAFIQFRVPGFAVALIEDGKIRYMKGFGVREFGKEDPVTTQTIFQIGSVTKSMTATLIARLASEDKIDLNAKVIDYVPDFKYCDENHTQNLTIKDILAQRSGLPGYAGDADIQGGKYYQEVLPSLESVEPVAPLGQKFTYQNVLFCLAGQIAEKRLHKTMEALFQEKFFNPLGLEHASLGIKSLAEHNNKASAHQVGRVFTKVLPHSEFGYRVPYAGGINLSIEDLAKYTQLHINKGKMGGNLYIPESYMEELHKVQIDSTGQEARRYLKYFFPKERVKRTGYGLGWRTYDWGGEKAVGHGGFVRGQVALVSFLPDQKAGIAILANAATPLTPILRSYFFDLYLGLKEIDWLNRAKNMKARDEASADKAQKGKRVKKAAERKPVERKSAARKPAQKKIVKKNQPKKQTVKQTAKKKTA